MNIDMKDKNLRSSSSAHLRSKTIILMLYHYLGRLKNLVGQIKFINFDVILGCCFEVCPSEGFVLNRTFSLCVMGGSSLLRNTFRNRCLSGRSLNVLCFMTDCFLVIS